MKRICVSTYCDWNNYGSIMQSIGLKNMLNSMGYESYIIKDKPAPPLRYIPSLKLSKNIVVNARNVYAYCKRKQISKKYSNSLKFINDNVDIMYYDSYSVLKNDPPVADFYIAGSDQIWNPKTCHPVFFLDFVNSESKRIAYAASMGNINIPETKKNDFVTLLNCFDNISVRENDNAEVIAELIDKEINVNIDPAFLNEKEHWRNYEKPYNLKKPYILLYALYWNKSLNKQLKILHKKTGIDIVAICGGLSKIWANKKLFDVDPGQFLWLIDNAEAVISSSFHGVSFSIIFNKKIAAVINPNMPSRITNLLNTLGVKNSSITELMNVDTSFYEDVNKRILKEKEKSVEYLKKAFE